MIKMIKSQNYTALAVPYERPYVGKETQMKYCKVLAVSIFGLAFTTE